VGARGGIKSNYLAYLQDVAFQKYVVMHAFPGSTVAASTLTSKQRHTTLRATTAAYGRDANRWHRHARRQQPV
jgi:hypothetical protein